MTAMVITLAFGGVTPAAVDRGASGPGRRDDRRHPGPIRHAGGDGGRIDRLSLGEVWGDVQKASGAMDRIAELLNARPDIGRPARAQDPAGPGPGRDRVRERGSSPIPAARTCRP
ncbi:hypothetical protein ACRAWD_08405 [Caulobacter segnis]